MSTLVKIAQKHIETEELRDIAITLARYNLGICIPHMHHELTGEIIPLPQGVIVSEKDSVISFAPIAEIDGSLSEPVAWRWNGETIEAFASCCSTGSPV